MLYRVLKSFKVKVENGNEVRYELHKCTVCVCIVFCISVCQYFDSLVERSRVADRLMSLQNLFLHYYLTCDFSKTAEGISTKLSTYRRQMSWNRKRGVRRLKSIGGQVGGKNDTFPYLYYWRDQPTLNLTWRSSEWTSKNNVVDFWRVNSVPDGKTAQKSAFSKFKFKKNILKHFKMANSASPLNGSQSHFPRIR